MAITQLENFSGVAPGLSLVNVATPGALGLPGAYPYVISGGGWAAYLEPFGLQVEKTGGKYWLGGGTGYAPSSSLNLYILQLSALVAAATKTFVIAYRQKRKQATDTALNVPIFKTPANGTYPTFNIPANTTEWYIELVFNRVDNTIAIYKDGRLQSTTTITDVNDKAAFQANTWAIGIPVATTSGLYITDIYIVEDTGDDTPNGRLGPQDLIDIPLQVSANTGWDVTNLVDVLGRKDFGTDNGKYITGSNDGSVLKLKPVDGYVLPSQSNVSGVMFQQRAFYKPGSPSDINVKVMRGTHSDTVGTVLNSSLVSGDKGIRLVNNSHTSDETVPASALNGLEVSLTVVGR